MVLLGKIFLLIALASGIAIGYLIYLFNSPPDKIPTLEDKYWGPGQPKQDDKTIRPFLINITDSEINDLKDRLKRWRPGAESLEGVAFQYGFHRTQLNDILEYWRTKYDWKKREKLLNSFPQYKTQISGLDIHFLHVKPDSKTLPKNVEVLPLLLLHGWPGSVKEFYNLIPLLTTPRTGHEFVFEVIAPSLPGYGWSQGSSKQGFGLTSVGNVIHKFMLRLGFNKYYIQGGDWGSPLGACISIFYPESVLGFHTNMCEHASQIRVILSYILPWIFAREEPAERMSNQLINLLQESGYSHIQVTKPDTIGAALSDSPAGLAAYILEKFSSWTNPEWKSKQDGGLSYYQRDDLLDNIMIYWLSNSITTSMRLYSECFTKTELDINMNRFPITVPAGCARFPHEIFLIPKGIIENGYKNLIRYTDMPTGGHFAAFEVPELLAEEIWQFTLEARIYHKQQEAKR